MSAGARSLAGALPRARRASRPGPWTTVGALAVTETISYGVLYYAFAVFLVPMQRDLGLSAAELTGAFSVALLVSGAGGILVGRHLDRRGPRALMTVGSIAGVLLVAAWSQVGGLAALYLLWAGIGIVMAMVLYEPAFTVLAKRFPDAGERRRAMTAMTLVAALASFVFLPLAQALIDAHGWRPALLVLAAVLALTVPLHAWALPSGSGKARASRPAPISGPSATAAAALRTSSFWLLSAAFVLASIATIAMTVHSIPFLLERGYEPAFAAFAVGLIGIAQIPGRILFAPLAARAPRPWATAAPFILIAAGIAVLLALPTTVAVLAGTVVLGMGNGMATLARATTIADFYGAGAYGTIAGAAAALTTAARAISPVAAAACAAVAGYPVLLVTLAASAALAAVLAMRAERVSGRVTLLF